MSIYSDERKGTEFRVYLPAKASAASKPAAAEQHSLLSGNGELVLVVDDEAAIRDIAVQTLTLFGYRVLPAQDGPEAIALCAQHIGELQVMLTDMAMPNMDGIVTIRAVRKMAPQIKIIAASGLLSDANVNDLKRLRVETFLQKPYTAATLVRTLHEILQR